MRQQWVRWSSALAGALTALGVPLSGASAFAAPGDLDASFGAGGIVKTNLDPASADYAQDLAVDASRRILVATRSGTDQHGSLVRYLPEGGLDPSFGAGGVVPFAPDVLGAVIVQPDGRIVVGGERGNRFLIARLNADGSPDASFGGGDGFVTTDVSADNPSFAPETEASVTALARGPDGRITALGQIRECGISCAGQGLALARYDDQGNLDPGFGGGDGLVTRGSIYRATSLAQQPDGRIIVGGSSGDLIVFRFTSDGVPDASFSGDGVFTTKADTHIEDGIGNNGQAHAVLLRPNGRIIVVGETTLLRLKPDGSRDRQFGDKGFRSVDDDITSITSDTGAALMSDGMFDANGRIVVVGSAAGRFGSGTFVARLTRNGRFDPPFGGDGVVVSDASKFVGDPDDPDQQRTEAAIAVALQPDLGIVTAGYAVEGGQPQVALARHNSKLGRVARCQGRRANLQGTSARDRLTAIGVTVAFGGNDRIETFGGLLCAGPGNDRVKSPSTHHTIYGGAGNDRISVAGDRDRLFGGPGADLIRSNGEGNDALFGGGGPDRLLGGRGVDRLFGGSGADLLLGQGGADLLSGGSGKDELRGGDGTDRLRGGSGRDQSHAGPGGPPKAIYQGNRRGLRVRLRVQNNRIEGVHIRARLRCKNGNFEIWNHDTNHASIRIRKGKFRYHHFSSSDYGFTDETLAGRVRSSVVTGHYRVIDQFDFLKCVTGNFEKASVRFSARRIKSRVTRPRARQQRVSLRNALPLSWHSQPK